LTVGEGGRYCSIILLGVLLYYLAKLLLMRTLIKENRTKMKKKEVTQENYY